MTFKKIALAAAIASVSMSAFAVESLDDAALSDATGQDGLTISLDLNVQTDTIIHDTDGVSGIAGVTSYTAAGAIVIDDMAIRSNGIVVTIDAGDDVNVAASASAAPMLNVNVDLANGITIITGAIGVANSRRDEADWGINGNAINIVNTMTIVLGATSLNIQLGNEQQGTHAAYTYNQAPYSGTAGDPVIAADASTAMIQLDATITGGIQLGSMGINDANSGGTIGNTLTQIVDNGGTDLNIDVEVNVTTAGLNVYIYQLGDLERGADIRITDQYLGSTSAGIIGDIEMQGLQLRGTNITIAGHGN